MSRSILLDTCAALWIADGARLEPEAVQALNESAAQRVSVMISPITALEVGRLVSRGRYPTTMTVKGWFDSLVVPPYSALVELTSDVLIDSSFMPGTPPNDPADRIIIATARAHGYRIMTRDRKILDYADQGHVQAIAC